MRYHHNNYVEVKYDDQEFEEDGARIERVE